MKHLTAHWSSLRLCTMSLTIMVLAACGSSDDDSEDPLADTEDTEDTEDSNDSEDTEDSPDADPPKDSAAPAVDTAPADTATNLPVALTWTNDVQPLLNSCNGCHIYSTSGTLNWANGSSDLVNVPSNQSSFDLVEPGNHLQSYWWHKINGSHTAGPVGGTGNQMPPSGSLSSTSVDTIRDWINDGAEP